ncbi:endo-1,4-beta-xylanase [Amphibacillus cookii]|uniref:endo-1,4-beta-xylanase n=1 Tax=Amphibacillus cookii TaxID=767787 RepID=UPI0019564AA0|nr:endo-1,4-beta-xylanase [Amphibacillus cookii]
MKSGRGKGFINFIVCLLLLTPFLNFRLELIKAMEQTTAEQPSIIYQETFANGLGVIEQAGDASLEVVSKAFEGNDNDQAVYVSDRLNNWDGFDIKFTDAGMEDGDTYTITVLGFIDEDEKVSDDSQVYLQAINSYDWIAGADLRAGYSFTLTGQYTVDRSQDTAVRIQSNTTAADVPFYIGHIVVEQSSTDNDDRVDQRPPAQDFTIIDFEDQTSGGFERRGDTEVLTVTDEENYTPDGRYALKVTERTENWHGPALRIEPYIDIGHQYDISVWVKLDSPANAQLQLSTQIGSDNQASYHTIHSKTIQSSDGWVQLEGSYRYNSAADEYVAIYIESSEHRTASFYIDDITIERSDTENIDIERDLTPIKDVYKDDFLIGNAVSANDLQGSRLELLTMHHQLVTAENVMKPDYAYNADRAFDFQSSNQLVEQIVEQDLLLHGHVLVWHQQSPEWLHSDQDGQPLSRSEALANLERHIENVLINYGEHAMSWDVVNEAMLDNPSNPSDWRAALRRSGWYHAIGDDYVEQAFLIAKRVIDENGWDIKLYYNDYNDDNQNKAEAIYQMVKEINENYAASHHGDRLIDGIGMQGHYNLNTNPANVRLSIEKFISLGVEIGVTELDIMAGNDHVLTDEQANAQAYLYARLFQIYKQYANHISRVTFWGLNDGSSWRSEQTPLVFDGDLQAKPAYYAIIDPDTFIESYEVEETEANQGKAIYGTPIIDGEIDPIWEDAPPLAVNRYQMAWQGATGVARVLWDQDHLYVLFEVNGVEFDKSSDHPWEQDSVEVFIDENNHKTTFYQEDDGQYRVNFDNETSFSPTHISEGFESATRVDREGNSYTVEMKIPFRTINPEVKQSIGFDLQINDAKDGARQSIATWNDTTGQAFQDPSVFGVLTLVEATEDQEQQPKEIVIDANKTVSVLANQKVIVRDRDISIKMPEDLPRGTKIRVTLIEDLIDAISKQNRPLKKAGDVVTVDLVFPDGDQDYRGAFILELAYDQDLDFASIFYQDQASNRWERRGGKRNPETGIITLTVPGFSTYGVFVDNLEAVIEDLDDQIRKLIERLEQLEKQGYPTTHLRQLITDLEHDIDQLHADIDNLDQSITELLTRLQALETELNNLEDDLKDNDSPPADQETDVEKISDDKDLNQDNQIVTTGEILPATATSLYNYLLLGALILIAGLGLYLYYYYRKKQKMQ